MHTKYCHLLIAIASTLIPQTIYADESDPARSIAEAIIKAATLKCVVDRTFDIAAEPFHGKIHAVDPKERIVIDIEDLQIDENRVLATYTIAGRFQFAGQMATDKLKRDLNLTADVSVRVELTANYRAEKGAFIVDAQIIDLDKFEMDIVKLTPGDLPGGKEAVVKETKRVLDDNMESLIDAIEKWLAEHNRY